MVTALLYVACFNAFTAFTALYKTTNVTGVNLIQQGHTAELQLSLKALTSY